MRGRWACPSSRSAARSTPLLPRDCIPALTRRMLRCNYYQLPRTAVGVTCSCRGYLPGASLARQLTRRNLMRLPGQSGSLVCATSRPERVQQDLLKDLVGAGEQRRRNSEGIARDMAGRMIGPVSTTKTKPSTNVQSGRQTAGGHGILRAWARTSGLKPGQIEDIDKCNEGIACSDRRCDGMRAQGCA